jgi:hypothetical protein
MRAILRLSQVACCFQLILYITITIPDINDTEFQSKLSHNESQYLFTFSESINRITSI